VDAARAAGKLTAIRRRWIGSIGAGSCFAMARGVLDMGQGDMPMRLSHLAFAAAAGLSLAACTPADAALDGDLVVNGLDPAAWTVVVTRAENKTAISIVGEAEFQGPAPVKASAKTPEGKDEFTLTSTTPKGDFVIRLRQEPCLDGIDNNVKYEWAASVDWNDETLVGCARPVDRD
jgi:uncharacterized membrane protein